MGAEHVDVEAPRYLIASGTSRYPCLGGKADLESVPKDVALMVDCFSHLGYQQILPEISADSTSQMFLETISNWLHRSERTIQDRVVLYYSGHGVKREDHHYLLFRNSRKDEYAATAVEAENSQLCSWKTRRCNML